MNFLINKNSLQKTLLNLSKIVPLRTTMPILSCAKFKLVERDLIITTTNLETTMFSKLEVDNATENIEFVIPILKSLEIISAINDRYIEFEIIENRKIKILTKTGEYNLMGMEKEEFPTNQNDEEKTSLQIKTQELKKIIKHTKHSIGKDDLKPALQGLFFKKEEDKIICVSTDGHRLVKIEKKEENNEMKTEKIIPEKFLDVLYNLLEKEESAKLEISENHIKIQIENNVLISRTIKEKYPDYNQVIPKENNKKVKIDKKTIIEAIKRISILSNKISKQINLKIKENEIEIKTEDPENITSGTETITCEYEGEAFEIGFNATYLREAISNTNGEKIEILMKDNISAAIISPEEKTEMNLKTLIMPLRSNL